MSFVGGRFALMAPPYCVFKNGSPRNEESGLARHLVFKVLINSRCCQVGKLHCSTCDIGLVQWSSIRSCGNNV